MRASPRLPVGCFLAAPVTASGAPPPATSAASLPLLSLDMLAAVVTALRAVFLTYDGWYSPIYMSEESTQPALTMPRALHAGQRAAAAAGTAPSRHGAPGPGTPSLTGRWG